MILEQRPVDTQGGDRRGAGTRRAWLLLLVAAILIVPVVYRLAYRDAIYPGVAVAGIDLGGQRPAEALATLAAAGVAADAPVVLAAADRTWSLAAGESGLSLDLRSSVAAALAVGRGSGPGAVMEMIAARLVGRRLPARVTLDETTARRTIADLAATFDRPPLDAAVRFDGGVVAPEPPATGLSLQQDQALATLAEAAAGGLWPVRRLDLPYLVTQPAVSDASAVVARAEELLARPVTLLAGAERWELKPEALAPMLTSTVAEGEIGLDIRADAFREWMAPVTEAISRTATMPRFHFDAEHDELVLVAAGVPGVSVDLAHTAKAILTADRSGYRVSVATQPVPPLIADNIRAQQLGIRELVHSETSRFSGSPRERIHNIGVAAAKYDGLLIPPESVFSFNEHLGDVSEEEGYLKTKIIMDGATADGVGGGVCQVSTTLFRAAFWSGLPIVERQAHGYRVGYYEQGTKPGLDATIYSPVVDLEVQERHRPMAAHRDRHQSWPRHGELLLLRYPAGEPHRGHGWPLRERQEPATGGPGHCRPQPAARRRGQDRAVALGQHLPRRAGGDGRRGREARGVREPLPAHRRHHAGRAAASGGGRGAARRRVQPGGALSHGRPGDQTAATALRLTR